MSEADSQHTLDMEIINDDAIHNVQIVEIKSLGLDWDHVLSEQGLNTCEIPTLETESLRLEENELNCSSNSRKNVSFSENSSILHYSENEATITLSNLVPKTIISARHSPQELKLSVPQLPDNIGNMNLKYKLNLLQEVKNTADTSQFKRNLETNFSCKEPKLSVLKVDKTCISQHPIHVAHLSRSDETDLSSIRSTHDTSVEFSEKSLIEKFCQSQLDEKLKEKNDQNANLEKYLPLKKAVVLLERLNLPVRQVNENSRSAFHCNAAAENMNSDSFSAVDDKMIKSESLIHSREIILVPESEISKKSNSSKRSSKAKSSAKKKKKVSSISAVSYQKSPFKKKIRAPIFKKRIKKNINSVKGLSKLNSNDNAENDSSDDDIPLFNLGRNHVNPSNFANAENDSSDDDVPLMYLGKDHVNPSNFVHVKNDAENDSSDDDVPLIDLGKNHVNPFNFVHANLLPIRGTHNTSVEFSEESLIEKFCLTELDEKLKEKNAQYTNLEKCPPLKKAVVLLKRLNLPVCHVNKNAGTAFKHNTATGNMNSDTFSAVDDKMRKSESLTHSREIISIPESEVSKKSNSSKRSSKSKSSAKNKKVTSISAVNYQKSALEKKICAPILKKRIKKNINSVKGISKLNADAEKDSSDDDVPLFKLGKSHVNPSNFVHVKNGAENDSSDDDVPLMDLEKNHLNPSNFVHVKNDAENDSSDDDVPLTYLGKDHVNPSNFVHVNKNAKKDSSADDVPLFHVRKDHVNPSNFVHVKNDAENDSSDDDVPLFDLGKLIMAEV